MMIFIGIRTFWMGVRGLREKKRVRYGWPLSLFISRDVVEDPKPMDRVLKIVGDISRLIFGGMLISVGLYAFWLNLPR